MSLVIHPINRPFSPANTYPSSFWLLCFIPTFITKTLTIHYQDTHYSLSTSPHLSLAINYHLKIKRFFLSYLTLLFSVQSTFCERRFVIHLKYFLQIYPPYNLMESKKLFAQALSALNNGEKSYFDTQQMRVTILLPPRFSTI